MKSTIDYYLNTKGLHDLEYLTFIDSLLLNKLTFSFFDSSLLNIRNGTKSGDLDLIISLKCRDRVFRILKSSDYRLYANINTNQYIFAKLGTTGALVLIHIHFDLYLYGKKYFDLEEAYESDFALKKEYQIYSMILFCLAKGKVRDFERIFLESSNIAQNDKVYSSSLKFLTRNSFKLSYFNKFKFFINSNFLSFTDYILRNMFNKFKSLFLSRNINFVFVGVDGAGKSTLIDNVSGTIGHGFVVKTDYFGLKESLVNQHLGSPVASHGVSGGNNFAVRNRILSLRNTLMMLKSILLLTEYTARLFKRRLRFSLIPIIWLDDRSFIDRMFYDHKFLIRVYCLLLRNYTFVFVSGNIEKLYERKAPVPLQVMTLQNDFYRDFASRLNKVLLLDSTELNQDECSQKTLESILKELSSDF